MGANLKRNDGSKWSGSNSISQYDVLCPYCSINLFLCLPKKFNLDHISLEVVLDLVKNSNIDLKSTHERLCFPVIKRLYTTMKIGIKFSAIKVDGDLIIDGHHRYLASLLAEVCLEKHPSNRTSATKVSEWDIVEFDEDDWDTEAKILFLNEKDAIYNGITLEKLHELLK